MNGTKNKFLTYNGKEFEEVFDLNLYEMDVRSYDPAIGRWTSIDPVTHHSMSTYNAFDNNPALIADPSGADGAQNIAGSYGWDTMFFMAGGSDDKSNATAVDSSESKDENTEEENKELEEEPGTVHLDEVVVTLGNERTYDLAALLISLQIQGTPYYDYLDITSGEYAGLEIRPIEERLTRLEVSPLLGGIYRGGLKGLAYLWRILTKGKDVAKIGNQFMKYQKNFVLNPGWKKNWIKYMSKRRWSFDDIQNTLLNGKWKPHNGTNYLNPGNSMSVVTNPNTGKSLVIDNVTKEIIQLGGKGFKF